MARLPTRIPTPTSFRSISRRETTHRWRALVTGTKRKQCKLMDIDLVAFFSSSKVHLPDMGTHQSVCILSRRAEQHRQRSVQLQHELGSVYEGRKPGYKPRVAC